MSCFIVVDFKRWGVFDHYALCCDGHSWFEIYIGVVLFGFTKTCGIVLQVVCGYYVFYWFKRYRQKSDGLLWPYLWWCSSCGVILLHYIDYSKSYRWGWCYFLWGFCYCLSSWCYITSVSLHLHFIFLSFFNYNLNTL